MEIAEKYKAMLADDLSLYIKDKHTQEECIGFIAGYEAVIVKLVALGEWIPTSESKLDLNDIRLSFSNLKKQVNTFDAKSQYQINQINFYKKILREA